MNATNLIKTIATQIEWCNQNSFAKIQIVRHNGQKEKG